ncbi:MAG: hypothetical protein BWZ10_01200 [candidate division BRC1 bacterium ADurb.BinA364]|nr:MAG: hypothetical protein BWZ10_01200 [candidate division BRC1 bacterium ADurb.BinA364]
MDRRRLGRRRNPRWKAICRADAFWREWRSASGRRERALAHGRLESRRFSRRFSARVRGLPSWLERRADAFLLLRHGAGGRGPVRHGAAGSPRRLPPVSQRSPALLFAFVLEPQPRRAGRAEGRTVHRPAAPESRQAPGGLGAKPHTWLDGEKPHGAAAESRRAHRSGNRGRSRSALGRSRASARRRADRPSIDVWRQASLVR